jgi:hypothetical protein
MQQLAYQINELSRLSHPKRNFNDLYKIGHAAVILFTRHNHPIYGEAAL